MVCGLGIKDPELDGYGRKRGELVENYLPAVSGISSTQADAHAEGEVSSKERLENVKAKLCKFRLDVSLIDKWYVGNTRKPGEEDHGKKHGFGGTMAHDSSQSISLC